MNALHPVNAIRLSDLENFLLQFFETLYDSLLVHIRKFNPPTLAFDSPLRIVHVDLLCHSPTSMQRKVERGRPVNLALWKSA
jgi:hypothetical protein